MCKDKKEKCLECNEELELLTETPIGVVARKVAAESRLWSLYFQRTAYYQCPGCKTIYSRTRSAKAVPIEKTHEEMMSGWAFLASMDCMTLIARDLVDKGELIPGALEKVWDWMEREQVEALAPEAKEGVITTAQANDCVTKLLIKQLERSDRWARKKNAGDRIERNSHRAGAMRMKPNRKSKTCSEPPVVCEREDDAQRG